MRSADDIKKLIKNAPVHINEQMNEKVLDGLLSEFKNTPSAAPKPSIWRIIMKAKLTKLAVAAVVIVAVILTIGVFNKTMPTASASQILQDAIDAVSDLWSVHMKAKMRTRPSDNFSNIGSNYDFVPIEMWKRTDENGLMQWRVEKPGRVLLTGTVLVCKLMQTHLPVILFQVLLTLQSGIIISLWPMSPGMSGAVRRN